MITAQMENEKENNENVMTSTVWAGNVFLPNLWPFSARRHSLAGHIKTKMD